MTHKDIDKLMKPYWNEKFNDAYLGEHRKELSGWEDAWDGVIMKRPDGSEILIVGYPVPDDNPNTWFYDGNIFSGGDALFNLYIQEFNKSMVRYINEKYNLKVKSVL